MTDEEAEAEIAAIMARHNQPRPKAAEIAAEFDALQQLMDRNFPGLREGKPVKPPPDNLLPFKAPNSVHDEDSK